MRSIVLDTETTGVAADAGDRIIQFAAVELENMKKTGRTFSVLINPEDRPVCWEAYLIHRISQQMLADQPTFKQVYPQIVDFVRDSRLIIHNAPFDLRFLAEECLRAGLPNIFEKLPVEDTIVTARRLWPGQPVSLDAIARRTLVSLETRKRGHDALVDCEILADTYYKMRMMLDTPHSQGTLFDALTTAKDQPVEDTPIDGLRLPGAPNVVDADSTAFPQLFAFSYFTNGRSILSPKSLASLSKTSGIAALCDDGVLAGAYEISSAAKAAKIPVIIGQRFVGPRMTITAHATNANGWARLCKLSSSKHLEHKCPEATDFLSDGLWITLDASSPAIDNWAKTGNTAELQPYLDAIAPENLLISITRQNALAHRDVAQAAANAGIAIIAAPIAACETPADTDALAAISETKTNDVTTHYLTHQEILELYRDLPSALANAYAAVKFGNFSVSGAKPVMPHFPGANDEKAQIRTKAFEGILWRFNTNELTAGRSVYYERLSLELDLITRLGFSGYFLIVSDFIGFARRNNIPVGPGRGSGAGSLVAWAMGITDLDPIRFGLFFERFINPARVSPPDFDIDFCEKRRDEVIAYIVDTYGIERTAQIGAWMSMGAKAAWRAAGRAAALTPGQINRLAKLIPKKTDSLKEAIETTEELRQMVENDVELAEAMQVAMRLEGIVIHRTRHPAGIVVSDFDLSTVTPLIDNAEGPANIAATQFDMKSVESVGLIKFDFLGLKTLTIVARTQELLKQHGVDLEPWSIGYDDPEVYKMLNQGHTLNVFQLGQSGMTKALKQIHTSEFEDLIALVSLYRPGPMDQIPIYAERKAGQAPISYPHPALSQVLASTYGIPIYQEQIMDLARTLAGYSLADADLLRRAMGKKIPEEMAALEESFIAGCVNNTALDPRIEIQQAKDIFAMVTKFAGYGFNRSHAAAYARISWVTAWLKYRYYEAFTAACLDHEKESENIERIIREAKHFTIPISPVDINLSEDLFTIESSAGKTAIRYSFGALTGLGSVAPRAIVEERKARGAFVSFESFVERIGRSISQAQIRKLICAGAFDTLFPNTKPELSRAICLTTAKIEIKGAKIDDLFFDQADVKPMTVSEMIKNEADSIGFSLSRHPVDAYRNRIDGKILMTLQAALKAAPEMRTATIVELSDIRDERRTLALGSISAFCADGVSHKRIDFSSGVTPPAEIGDTATVVVIQFAKGTATIETIIDAERYFKDIDEKPRKRKVR